MSQKNKEVLDKGIERKVLENMTEGVVWTADKGTVVYMNDSAGRILGLDGQETVGKKFAAVFVGRSENDRFVQAVIDSTTVKEGTAHEALSDFTTQQGDLRHLEVSNTCMRTSKKRGVLSVITDITEEIELQQLRKESSLIVAASIGYLCGFLLLYRFITDYFPASGTVVLSRTSELAGLLLCAILFPKSFVWEIKNRVLCKDVWKAIRPGLAVTALGIVLLIAVKLVLIRYFPADRSFFYFGFLNVTDAYYPLTVWVQEFVSRCFLLESLARVYTGKRSKLLAVITTSLIFAILHIGHNFIYMILAGILMGALGLFYLKTKNIWSTAIVHYVMGEMICILSYVP